MSRQRLHYGSVPNMAGMYHQAGLTVPAAPAFIPENSDTITEREETGTQFDADPPAAGNNRSDADPQPSFIIDPISATVNIAASPVAKTPSKPAPQPAVSSPISHAARVARPAARVAPARPAVKPARPKPKKPRTAPGPDATGRIRRTLRIPTPFDLKLQDLAQARGVNLNSAVLAAIAGEWAREFRNRANP